MNTPKTRPNGPMPYEPPVIVVGQSNTSSASTGDATPTKTPKSTAFPNNAADMQLKTFLENEIDDELMYSTDADGNPIPDADIIAEAEAVKTLSFDFRGHTHRIEVKALNVPARLTNRLAALGAGFAIQAGFRPGDDLEAEASKAEKEGETSERIARLLALTEGSEELQRAHAEIAVAATMRDGKGRFRTSVPQFREGLTAEKLLSYGALGEGYVKAVRDWLRPT